MPSLPGTAPRIGIADSLRAVIDPWLDATRAGCDMVVTPGRLTDSAEWHVTDGRIAHRSGGFFSVVGVGVAPDPARGLSGVVSPIIDQPEVGLLGFVAHRAGDEVEILVQAKPEPGNVGLAQVAPTVQATRSNYLRLHGGRPTVLLEAFSDPGAVAVRVPQSEQGSRFLGKYNDNAMVFLDRRITEPGDEFAWFPVDAVLDALGSDFAVNTDARSVLVTAGPSALVRHREPFARPDTGSFGELLAASYRAGRADPIPTDDAERRLADARRTFRFAVEPVSVEALAPWVLDDRGLTDPAGELAVVHVAVTTSQREVPAWDQPLVTTPAPGDTVLLAQWRHDRLRFCFTCTPEVGLGEHVQVHPSVQRTPGPALRFAELDERDAALAALSAEATTVASALQSDEGGRFLDCVGRYSVALLPETTTVPDLAHTLWLSWDQIEALARRKGFFTNEARSVVSLVLGRA